MENVKAKAKKYELDVKPMYEFEGGGNVLGYYSKGHFEPALFAGQVNAEWEPTITPNAAAVVHDFWRLVPAGAGMGMLFKQGQNPGRGAFPVTVWEM